MKTMQNLNEKTRKLQEEYEVDCVKRKVREHLFFVPFPTLCVPDLHDHI